MKAVFLLFVLLSTAQLRSQIDSIQKVLDQYEQAFKNLSYDDLEPLLSSKFKLGRYSKWEASQIIPQIWVQYPPLKSIAFEEGNTALEKKCTYIFEEADTMRSSLSLNSNYQILSIGLFDEVMAQSASKPKAPKTPLDSLPFISKKQRKSFYRTMVKELNTLDAEAIETRKISKDISWKKYIKTKKKSFIQANNWTELGLAFEQFGKGFVNLHSHFNWSEKLPKQAVKTKLTIAVSYPDMHFFDRESNQLVSYLNDLPIEQEFQHYKNYLCAHNAELACAQSFVSYITRREYHLSDGSLLKNILLEDGTTVGVENVEPGSSAKSSYSGYRAAVDTTRKYSGWKLETHGYKVALYTKDNMALIRIKDFLYFNGQGGDIRCSEECPDSTLCYDVRMLREHLNQLNSVEHLIFDMRNNGGGNENSAFIAQFSQGPFYDLAIQYRKTKHLEDDKLRHSLFYGSNNTESWYQSIRENGQYDQVKDGDFLPMCADFCQGSPDCDIKPISPNASAQQFGSIYLLTNPYCISSCDDFVWRMSSYSGAKVVGQRQSADATYSRIGVVFYLSKKGEIMVAYEGDRSGFEEDGQRLCKMTIPYSKTVFSDGNTRQGVPAELDIMVPITIENYDNYTEALLEAVEKDLAAQKNK